METLDKTLSVVADRSGRKRLRADILIRECDEKNERNTVTLATRK
jgi:hypothetical protein